MITGTEDKLQSLTLISLLRQTAINNMFEIQANFLCKYLSKIGTKFIFSQVVSYQFFLSRLLAIPYCAQH